MALLITQASLSAAPVPLAAVPAPGAVNLICSSGSAAVTMSAQPPSLTPSNGYPLVAGAGPVLLEVPQSGKAVTVYGAAGTILNSNPSFEPGISPWDTAASGGVTVTQSEAWSYAGGYSGLMTVTPSATGSINMQDDEFINVSAGTTYEISDQVFCPEGVSDFALFVNCFNSGGSYLGGVYPSGITLPAGQVTQQTLTSDIVSAVPGTAKIQFGLQLTAAPAVTVHIYSSQFIFSAAGAATVGVCVSTPD
jgi:hypothetical protein